jgi:hypothetical protein
LLLILGDEVMIKFKHVVLISLLAIFSSVQAGDKAVTIEKTVVKTKNDGTVVTKTVTRTDDGNGNTSTTKTTTTTTTSEGGSGGASYEGE